MSDDGPDYSKTRNGLAVAARLLDRIRDRTQNEPDREALRVGAQLLRMRASEPEDVGPPPDPGHLSSTTHEEPWTYQKAAEGMRAGLAALTGSLDHAVKSLDDHTRATKRLTDAVARSTNFR